MASPGSLQTLRPTNNPPILLLLHCSVVEAIIVFLVHAALRLSLLALAGRALLRRQQVRLGGARRVAHALQA